MTEDVIGGRDDLVPLASLHTTALQGAQDGTLP